MRDVPIITLRVEALGETVTAAMARHAEEMSGEVERAVKFVVDNFDFEAEVRRQSQPIIAKAIGDAISSYFIYGEGHELMKEAVRAGLMKTVVK